MEGKVYGIDLTAEMLARAKENCKATGVTNVELVQVDNEEIPFQENMFDVVISNGAINLSPNKLRLFQEIHRVLKPGGRFQFADIVTKNKLPAELTESLEAWTQ